MFWESLKSKVKRIKANEIIIFGNSFVKCIQILFRPAFLHYIFKVIVKFSIWEVFTIEQEKIVGCFLFIDLYKGMHLV